MSEIVNALSARAARALTDEVKADAAALWAKLLRLYEGEAHVALGYSSWADYCHDEFDFGRSHSYRLLDSARVVDALSERQSPMGERVARELVPVLREDPEKVEEVWGEVVEEHGPAPTAAQARDVARRQTPAPPPLARKPRPKPATKTADRARDKVLELEQALERVDWPRVRQLRPDGWEGLLELRRIRDELDRLIAMLEPARDEVVVGGVLAEDVSDSPLDGIDDDGDTAAPGPRCAIFDVDPEDDWR